MGPPAALPTGSRGRDESLRRQEAELIKPREPFHQARARLKELGTCKHTCSLSLRLWGGRVRASPQARLAIVAVFQLNIYGCIKHIRLTVSIDRKSLSPLNFEFVYRPFYVPSLFANHQDLCDRPTL